MRGEAVKRHAAILTELADLRSQFADVHQRGMDCLRRRDLSGFETLLAVERELIDKQADLIKKLQEWADR